MEKTSFKIKMQQFGGHLAGMVIPNIGAFIAWGLITALFLETGWLPNEQLATLIGPILQYLIPVLISYTGGEMVYGKRGAVAGVVAASGAIFGSDVPMFLAAMILGPLGAYIMKKFDHFILNKEIPTGFEMLINNFSIGILGMLMAVGSFAIIRPIIETFTNFSMAAVHKILDIGLLPLLALVIEPAKVLFLNNAIDQGIFVPLGSAQILKEGGKTIFYMLVSSPAPGAGILLAYAFFGKGNSKQSAPSALLIEFIGGIHEVYFPYVLMKPQMFLAVILGGVLQIIVWVLLDAGLAGYPHPGSIVSFMIMLPKGGAIPVLLGIAAGIFGSFSLASFFLKVDKDEEEMEIQTDFLEDMGLAGKKETLANIETIIFACDAGIGSSAMGSGILAKKLKDADIDINVINQSVTSLPEDAKFIVTHKNLEDRVKSQNPHAVVRTVESFLNDPEYDRIVEDLSKERN